MASAFARVGAAPLAAGLLVAAGVALRLAWPGDIEFKGDERINLAYLVALGRHGWTPLAPISYHAGICHSSLFYYLVRFLSGGARDAVAVTRAIAAFNAAALVAAAWISRRRPACLWACALGATHVTLVVYSRKLWQPDLVAAWMVLALACLGAAFDARTRRRRAWLAAAALCLVAGAHMYTAAVFAAVVVGVTVAAWLLAARRRGDLGVFVGASVAGWLTFVPWAVALLRGTPGTRGPSAAAAHLSLAQLPPILAHAVAVASPYAFATLYLDPVAAWLRAHGGGAPLWAACALLAVAVVAGVALLAAALALVAFRRGVARDPLLVAALALLVANPVALFLVRLGSYPHYWLAVVPFALYVVAAALAGAGRYGARLLFAWGALSALAAVAFLGLVHLHHGLPGEYGPAYCVQQERAR